MKKVTNSVVRVLRTQSYAYSAWPLPSIWASKMYAVCSFQKQLEEPHVLIVMGCWGARSEALLSVLKSRALNHSRTHT